MCGIAGFMGQVENRADVIRNMTEGITHRGPDSDGFFTDDNISMGFRRLSIIDLGAGHQPIYNEDKSLVLTFNGEIYNYKDLRKELIAKGHKFYTDTDSEVLVHGFEEWKEDMLPKLRGMFGFAIYNTKDNSLFIARDFFGIKPMHFFGLLGSLMFILGFISVVIVGASKLYNMSHGMPYRLVTDSPYFYLSLTAMIIGTQLFLAGFLGELISRNAPERNNYLIEKII